jgi:hypothetical protein
MWIAGTLDVVAMLASSPAASADSPPIKSRRQPRGKQAALAVEPSHLAASDFADVLTLPVAVFPPTIQSDISPAAVSNKQFKPVALDSVTQTSGESLSFGALSEWDFGLTGLMPGAPLPGEGNTVPNPPLEPQHASVTTRPAQLSVASPIRNPAGITTLAVPIKARRRKSKAEHTTSNATLEHPIVDDAFLLSAADSALAALNVLSPASQIGSSDAKPSLANRSVLPPYQTRAFSSASLQRLQFLKYGLVCQSDLDSDGVTTHFQQPHCSSMSSASTVSSTNIAYACEVPVPTLEPSSILSVDASPWSKLDPLTTPIEAIIVRFDKSTGAVDVQRVVSLPTAFSAFLAALRLHEVLKMLPGGGNNGAQITSPADVTGPLLERLA